MRVAVTTLVVALFASGIGAPSVCAALCASAPAGAPQTPTGGHHDHHAGHGALPDTAAVSGSPCIEYTASLQVAMAPRPQESAAIPAVTVIQDGTPATCADRAWALLPVSRIQAVPLPDPPLRI